MTAQLSFTDKFYHGLRIQPSYDELFQASKKPLRIPVPDRSSKWFGLSNYRSLMLDAAKRFNNYEHLNLDYNESGAHLPLQAAKVASSSHDEAWDRIAAFDQGLEEQHDYERAFELLEEQQRQEATALRSQHLAGYAPNVGHWSIEAHHDELEQAGVERDTPVQRPRLTRTRLPAPIVHPVEANVLGRVRPFPTFEELNLSQPRRLNSAQPAPARSSYERLREEAL